MINPVAHARTSPASRPSEPHHPDGPQGPSGAFDEVLADSVGEPPPAGREPESLRHRSRSSARPEEPVPAQADTGTHAGETHGERVSTRRDDRSDDEAPDPGHDAEDEMTTVAVDGGQVMPAVQPAVSVMDDGTDGASADAPSVDTNVSTGGDVMGGAVPPIAHDTARRVMPAGATGNTIPMVPAGLPAENVGQAVAAQVPAGTGSEDTQNGTEAPKEGPTDLHVTPARVGEGLRQAQGLSSVNHEPRAGGERAGDRPIPTASLVLPQTSPQPTDVRVEPGIAARSWPTSASDATTGAASRQWAGFQMPEVIGTIEMSAASVQAGLSQTFTNGGGSGEGDSQQEASSGAFVRFLSAAAAQGAMPAFAVPADVPAAVTSSVPPQAVAAAPAPAEAAENVAALIQTIRISSRSGVWEATVRLKPDQMGEVTIALTVDRNSVSAVVHAGSAGVREWLQAHEEHVRSGLSDQGLHLARFIVEPDGQRREETSQEAPKRRTPRRVPPTTNRFDVTV